MYPFTTAILLTTLLATLATSQPVVQLNDTANTTDPYSNSYQPPRFDGILPRDPKKNKNKEIDSPYSNAGPALTPGLGKRSDDEPTNTATDSAFDDLLARDPLKIKHAQLVDHSHDRPGQTPNMGKRADKKKGGRHSFKEDGNLHPPGVQ